MKMVAIEVWTKSAAKPRVFVPEQHPDVVDDVWTIECHHDPLGRVAFRSLPHTVDGVHGETLIQVVVGMVTIQQGTFLNPQDDFCSVLGRRHVFVLNCKKMFKNK